ncbi:hypothetical protein [Paraflavitalea speifideaquila]|uniref:hypothetical protein n=1 Tax=Paraflavitalea speifideaquila TaxID=3076558 RepID=UPI0028E214FE|nr:hypothetical protein [Paraflavitalea speifideiaquila]
MFFGLLIGFAGNRWDNECIAMPGKQVKGLEEEEQYDDDHYDSKKYVLPEGSCGDEFEHF